MVEPLRVLMIVALATLFAGCSKDSCGGCPGATVCKPVGCVGEGADSAVTFLDARSDRSVALLDGEPVDAPPGDRSGEPGPADRAQADETAQDTTRTDLAATEPASDDRGPEVDAAPPGCEVAGCREPGHACVAGACEPECRASGASPCAAGSVCDYTDGRCRAPGACVLEGAFTPCGTRRCGPGLECDGAGACVNGLSCVGLECEPGGRCFGRFCPCERPAPACSVAPLAQLNRPDFAGARPTNERPDEGIMDLEFDDVCAAYAVTVISGTDQLRQLTPDGRLTAWNSVSNLDMGEVALLRLPGNRPGTRLGDVAATYICIAGCLPTGEDGQMGVIRLDRTSMTRPLPNVVAAAQTTGTGPFGNRVVDAGPYGLTWGRDETLFVGNLGANGELHRVDLVTRRRTLVAMFSARVHASTVYDAGRLLVAVAGGMVFLVPTAGGTPSPWASLGADVTSLARDFFTGRVYAELNTAPPTVVELRGDGSGRTTFQTAPRLGRIALAPDGYLYHASVYPNVQWTSATSPPIVRWPLPARR
ncbi:MAG: hypothetical protein HY909_07960 [Deltaproteobacteria bacterium]|nr:hypothetical protein [Deltaproteobacteria bacterium]